MYAEVRLAHITFGGAIRIFATFLTTSVVATNEGWIQLVASRASTRISIVIAGGARCAVFARIDWFGSGRRGRVLVGRWRVSGLWRRSTLGGWSIRSCGIVGLGFVKRLRRIWSIDRPRFVGVG